MPMGLNVAPDVFNREVAIAFSKNPNLKNIVREMDDVLVFGNSSGRIGGSIL